MRGWETDFGGAGIDGFIVSVFLGRQYKAHNLSPFYVLFVDEGVYRTMENVVICGSRGKIRWVAGGAEELMDPNPNPWLMTCRLPSRRLVARGVLCGSNYHLMGKKWYAGIDDEGHLFG